MSECYSDKFIINECIKEKSEFNEKFLYDGKSLYEVIRIIKGVPLFLEDHLKRLYKSAETTNLEIWLKREDIEKSIKELSKINSIENGNVKIIFNYNKDNNKNFLCYFIRTKYPSKEMYEKGVKTVLYQAERENPTAKVINTNLREATDRIIQEREVYEVILVNKDGYITEGSRSNIFMIKNSNVYTAPVCKVLPGITRDYIIKACENLGYEVIEESIHYKDIENIEGLFISGTSPKVLPVSQVENKKFDAKNKIITAIMNEYDRILEEYINSNR
ncbi:MAG: aminotransferase class IV [Clostridium thermopalmarium]|uniref:aminotransferase class IV n=1 Tax=Clostridium thermopalmarium TaxID=29373 RepID=UPI002357FBDC|nr:aminotransferase class IV [Clostridium thermopalmarium]MBE6044679.1 aminotransferase class IV [Clostridium thermopalmarium]